MEEDHKDSKDGGDEEEDDVIVLLEHVELSKSSSSENLTVDVLRSTVSFYVPDEGGRALWSRSFLQLAQVPWDKFMSGIFFFFSFFLCL